MKVKAKHKYGLIGFVYLFGLICASFLDSIPCFVFFGVIGVIFGLALEKSSIFFRINLEIWKNIFISIIKRFHFKFYVFKFNSF